jgi:3'(2'), 5'-bisphosphate nucleotidase
MYFACHGHGAALEYNNRVVPLRVSAERIASRMTIALSRSHRSGRVDRMAGQLRIHQVIRIGSVGLKVGLISEGRAHLYIHAGNQTKIWDTCAPEAILFEAGGRLTDLSGRRLDYTRQEVHNPNGIIATNGLIHDRAVRVALQIIGGSSGPTTKG